MLEENRDVHAALRDALIERDELVRDDILEVIEQAIAARVPDASAGVGVSAARLGLHDRAP